MQDLINQVAEEGDMTSIALFAVVAIGILIFFVVRLRRSRKKREFERHFIDPEALHALLSSNQNVLVVDVRQPLDFIDRAVERAGRDGLIGPLSEEF